MNYATRVVWNWSNITPVLVAENTRLYVGLVAYCKGASAEQNELAKSSAAFNTTLQNGYATAFANQQAIFSAVKSVYDPIFKAGPSQYGFSNVEDATLRTQAGEGTAANYQMASKAAAERSAAAGGGNAVLPSGVQADITGKIAATAAQDIGNKQLGITSAGYEVGRQNFKDASNAEMGVAGMLNPLGYAGAATNQGNSAFNMASEIQKANAAASPWGTIGGIVGGIAGKALSAYTGGASSAGGFLGNAGDTGGQYLGSASSGSNNWGGFGTGDSYT